MQYFISILTIILILGCVCFLAYVMTKFVGKKSMNIMKSKYMKVVDSLSMGFDRTIYLVRVGQQYVLMYSSTKGFEFICNIDSNMVNENIVSDTSSNENGFSKYFDFFKPGRIEEYKKEDNSVNKNVEKLRNLFNNKK